MAYSVWSVVFGEQPSAAKWNILGANDASFNDGTGIANQTITPNHLALSADTATVTTTQTTTSTSYTDLATVGPTVTVTVGVNGKVLVFMSSKVANNTANAYTHVAFAVSGANTIAAADINGIYMGNHGGTPDNKFGIPIMLEGLSTGATAFTLKYKVSGGTGTYQDRILGVVAI